MSDKAKEIRKNYNDIVKSCNLSQMEVWDKQEEITDILFDKGYDFVNFINAPCRWGYFNGLACLTKHADTLVSQIKAAGFDVIPIQNPKRKSETWIVFPYNLTHEIRSIVDDFEVVT